MKEDPLGNPVEQRHLEPDYISQTPEAGLRGQVYMGNVTALV